MAKRHADIVILGEDDAHDNFVRHYLKRRKFNDRQLRFIVRKGIGSGAQFVLNTYPGEVKYYRRKANHLSCALVRVIEADANELRQVHRSLDTRLRDAHLGSRRDEDRIVLLTPKRNIETWAVYLQGVSVDEETNYKEHELAGNLKLAGTTLADRMGQSPEPECPHSLQEGDKELKARLPG